MMKMAVLWQEGGVGRKGEKDNMTIWQGLLLIVAGFLGGWFFCSMMTVAKIEDERTAYITELMKLRKRIEELEDILYRKEK